MMNHKERSHSVLSPSGAHRWLVCTPSALLEQQFPDTTSEAAQEGTLAHELAELKLRHYFFTTEFGKRKFNAAVKKLKENELWQDEMDGYTEEYLDYIKKTALSYTAPPYAAIEKRVDLSAYVPHLEDEEPASGTVDCSLIGGAILHVIDFKYGKSPDGRVPAENNPQLSLYALGIYEAFRIFYRIERVKLTIVQPRLPDGISEWETSVEELLSFGEYVKKRAAMAIKGEGDFHPDEKTCRYCRARGRCRARAEKNVQLAFAPDFGKPPALLDNAELGRYLTQGADVAKWLGDLQDAALLECLAGREVPGWKAVDGRGSREWTDMDEAFDKLTRTGIAPEEMLWERKPLTLAQVEKLVGKKDFQECVGEYVVKKPGKPALVTESDKRPAITNRVSAAEAFGNKEEK